MRIEQWYQKRRTISRRREFIEILKEIQNDVLVDGYPASLTISTSDLKHMTTSIGGDYSFAIFSGFGQEGVTHIVADTEENITDFYLVNHLGTISDITRSEMISATRAINLMTEFVDNHLSE